MLLDDETYLKLFETRTLAAEQFDHRGHLRIAWLHLRRFDEQEARRRVCRGIQALAQRFGAPEKYNQTMTEAFVQIVAARLQGPARDSFTAFLEANPELLSDAAAVLARYYSDSRLLSEQARQQWLEPDREAIK